MNVNIIVTLIITLEILITEREKLQNISLLHADFKS